MPMDTESSKLLNCQVPKDLTALIRSEGLNPQHAWLVTDTDLNLSGGYEAVFLLVEKDCLYTAGRTDKTWPRTVRIRLRREDVAEVRTRQGVGGGFLEALVDGVYVDILAYSNARADVFHKVARKLELWLEGQPVRVGPADDYNPRRCPKCGFALEFKGDLCRRCVNRGAVLSRVLGLMRPYASWATLMLGLLLIVIGLQMVPPRLVKVLVDEVVRPDPSRGVVPELVQRQTWLLELVAALFGLQIITAIINVVTGRLSSFVGTQVTYDLRKSVFSRLTKLSVDYYDRFSTGQLISRVVYDTEAMKDFVRQATQGFLAQILIVAVTGVMLFSISWKLALWTLLPAPLVIFASTVYWKRVYPRYFRVWDAWSRMTSSVNSILSGIRVVKAFGQENREEGRFDRTGAYVRDSARRVEYATSIFNPAMTLVFSLGGPIVWYVGGRDVISNMGLTLGSLMAFLGYLPLFYGPLQHMTTLTDWLTRFFTAAQRTFEILDTYPQIVEADDAQSLPQPKGAVSFNNIKFGYNRYEPVIKGVSFDIKPGEHVGIVGKSGSGKTTLINLLARFYDADEGNVSIDGVDVHQMKSEDLRRAIGVVLQEPFLFRGTIYNNLTYGQRGATPEQVLATAKAANAHDFIMRHPLGYDTYIGERGAGLSGGERQRVSIARALLSDPKILVLDEATSNVDTESEQLIQEALARVTADRTTIAIAHRLSTLKNCDRIFVMDDGELVEHGTHDELLAKGGLYHKLVLIQTELSREPSIDALSLKKP